MNKDYKTPDITKIELDQLDVITTSATDPDELNGGVVDKNDSYWTPSF